MGRTCSSCGAELHWLITPAGKFMPCDPAVVRVVTEEGQLVAGRIPHLVTCPNAEAHKSPMWADCGKPVEKPPPIAPPKLGAELRKLNSDPDPDPSFELGELTPTAPLGFGSSPASQPANSASEAWDPDPEELGRAGSSSGAGQASGSRSSPGLAGWPDFSRLVEGLGLWQAEPERRAALIRDLAGTGASESQALSLVEAMAAEAREKGRDPVRLLAWKVRNEAVPRLRRMVEHGQRVLASELAPEAKALAAKTATRLEAERRPSDITRAEVESLLAPLSPEELGRLWDAVRGTAIDMADGRVVTLAERFDQTSPEARSLMARCFRVRGVPNPQEKPDGK